MPRPIAFLAWLVIAVSGAWAFSVMARQRGEAVSSGYLVLAAMCTYAIGYRFYSKWLAAKALMLDRPPGLKAAS